jgi:hypothetical protein
VDGCGRVWADEYLKIVASMSLRLAPSVSRKSTIGGSAMGLATRTRVNCVLCIVYCGLWIVDCGLTTTNYLRPRVETWQGANVFRATTVGVIATAKERGYHVRCRLPAIGCQLWAVGGRSRVECRVPSVCREA